MHTTTDRHPLRRVIEAAEYIVHGQPCFYPRLSCGHLFPVIRSLHTIRKDVASRRRVRCRACQRDD